MPPRPVEIWISAALFAASLAPGLADPVLFDPIVGGGARVIMGATAALIFVPLAVVALAGAMRARTFLALLVLAGGAFELWAWRSSPPDGRTVIISAAQLGALLLLYSPRVSRWLLPVAA